MTDNPGEEGGYGFIRPSARTGVVSESDLRELAEEFREKANQPRRDSGRTAAFRECANKVEELLE